MVSNKTYDILKQVVQVVMPALVTFIGVVGAAFNWPHTEITIVVVGAATTLAGTVLGISNSNYKKENAE